MSLKLRSSISTLLHKLNLGNHKKIPSNLSPLEVTYQRVPREHPFLGFAIARLTTLFGFAQRVAPLAFPAGILGLIT
jgi:hypothetical protein